MVVAGSSYDEDNFLVQQSLVGCYVVVVAVVVVSGDGGGSGILFPFSLLC